MSNKSGVSEQVISLPKGGGALRGISETFSPDLHTGTGNFTVPIALPPGRNGFQPTLNLLYSSGNPNGSLGLGWSMSVPGVSRKTSDGVPRYRDGSGDPDDWDTFLLSGAEDLVPVPGGPAGFTRYQPRTEGLFARIDHNSDLDPANDFWEVRTKDGLVSTYGGPDAQDALAAIVDPDPPGNTPRVFAWHLTRTTDPFGNRIEYLYERDAVRHQPSPYPHHWDQLYLSEIWYVDYGDDPDAPQFLVKVKFDYQPRPDPFSDYRAGFEVRTVQRCTAIRICTYPDGVETPVRTYELTYLEPASLNGVSLLRQIRVVGHDGPATESLPPLEFGYTPFAPETKRDFFPITGPDLPPGSLAHPDYELADLFGSGLPDILEMNGTVRYWRNLGNGSFDRPRQMQDAPAGVRLADPGVQLLDADGDARIDLLTTQPGGLSGYYPLRFDGLWDRRSFQRYELAPSFNLEDPEVRLVDLTGDRVVDAVRSGTSLECFFNDPETGWRPENTRRVERGPLKDFPNVSFADSRVKWGDMNGDGLQDIVLIGDGYVDYWPSRGYGNWGKRISMRNSPRFPYGYNPLRILVGDVDGDGAADLVYVDNSKITVWINQGGNNWSQPLTISGTPSVSDMDAVRLADMAGGGVSGVLWSQDAGGPWRERMYFLNLTGGGKPYLLDKVDDRSGAVTRISYAPSTRFALDDQQHPATRWQTPLPFPVQVVARTEVVDAISGGKLTSEYCYHHGYWDGKEREFRGFGRVDQRDTQTFIDYHAPGLHPQPPAAAVPLRSFSPPTETRTWFHQGTIGDERGGWAEADHSDEYWPSDLQTLSRPTPSAAFLAGLPSHARRDALRTLRGRVLRTELYALDGTDRADRPYTVTEQLHTVTSLPIGNPWPASDPPAAWRLRVFFPHTLAERTTQWERGQDPLHRFRFISDHDPYGQPRSITAVAVPRGRDFRVTEAAGAPYLATHTTTLYAIRDDDQRYLTDRVARVTAHEVTNDGSLTMATLLAAVQDGTALGPVLEQTLNYYDGPAFRGLAFGQLGEHGALIRSERLVLTPERLQAAYGNGPGPPPYLTTGGPPAWTAEYPQEFRDMLPPQAGYRFEPGGPSTAGERGWFAATERRRLDVHGTKGGRGIVKVTCDPLGHQTRYDHEFDLLVTEIVEETAGVNLVTTATYDHRVLQPHEVTGPNGEHTLYAHSPLGLLASMAELGRPDEHGDTPEQPGIRLVYDHLAFAERGQPMSVRTIRRVHPATDANAPTNERNQTIETVEYSDGFGRLVQARIQAEDMVFGDSPFGDAGLPADQTINADAVANVFGPDAERVVVSGWRVYDNKGREVERFEPFFSTGWAFAPLTDAERGQKFTMKYDPLGRAIQMVHPDGSEVLIVHGVPSDPAAPERFTPSPWERWTYDVNDNAGRTHPAESAAWANHRNTPPSAVTDALGRTVETVERNGPSAADRLTTRSAYDLMGNLLSITDPLGRTAVIQVHDLVGQRLRMDSLDAGRRRTVMDAAGNAIEELLLDDNAKGPFALYAYDPRQRRVRLWARDARQERVALRERVVHGDAPDAGMSADEAAASHLLGRVHRHYDEAGLRTVAGYDFRGNPRAEARRPVADATVLGVFHPPPAGWEIQTWRMDWAPPAGTSLSQHADALLDPEGASLRTTSTYDALNRLRALHHQRGAAGPVSKLRHTYNRAGALERVDLDGTTFVRHIAYNAKGQRVLIAYGNGLMTRYVYDPVTFRLWRLRTERFTSTPGGGYHPTGPPLQDFGYAYDLAGNLLALRDRTPASGIPGQPSLGGLDGRDWLDQTFTYEPLYRLRTATGREADLPSAAEPWSDTPKGTDPNATRPYTQTYTYDRASNLRQLQHQSGWPQTGVTTTVRRLTLSGPDPAHPVDNRLHVVQVGSSAFEYGYDDAGNLTRETTSRHLEWDHAGRLRAFRIQAGGSEPTPHTHYLYDSTGQRLKKVVRELGGTVHSTNYVGGRVEHHRRVLAGQAHEYTLVHVMDGQQRIAMVRVGSAPPGDATPAVTYHLGDHLGSSNVVVDDTGTWINREEYFPYGETSFGSFSRKRYRFSAKERDEESGLAYHGARYYAPWLCRWTTCDPRGDADGLNLYAYVCACPTKLTDSNGTQSDAGVQQPIHGTALPLVAVQGPLGVQAQEGGGFTGTPMPPSLAAPKEIPGIGLEGGDWSAQLLDQTLRAPWIAPSESEVLGRAFEQLGGIVEAVGDSYGDIVNKFTTWQQPFSTSMDRAEGSINAYFGLIGESWAAAAGGFGGAARVARDAAKWSRAMAGAERRLFREYSARESAGGRGSAISRNEALAAAERNGIDTRAFDLVHVPSERVGSGHAAGWTTFIEYSDGTFGIVRGATGRFEIHITDLGLSSEEAAVNVMAHELNHIREWFRTGQPAIISRGVKGDIAAQRAGNRAEKFFRP
jgi:RHS repeat-associated protein